MPDSSVPPLYRILEQAQHLKLLPRTGWLFAGVTHAESIADHTCLTAFWVLLLGDEINRNWSEHGLSQPLNMERVLRLALLHDLAESVLTDLPHRTSQILGSDVKHAAEEEVVRQLTAELPNGDDLVNVWREYDAAQTPEARLVKDADKLEMLHQALQYERQGNVNVDEFWHGHSWNFPISQTLFEQLIQQRASLPPRRDTG